MFDPHKRISIRLPILSDRNHYVKSGEVKWKKTLHRKNLNSHQLILYLFISDLITTAYLYLQGFRDPETEQVIVNLGLAKRMIDTLEMLEEKTKGNLTAPESNFLVNSLYDLRMGYVRAVNSQKDAPEQDTSEDYTSTGCSERG